MEKGFSVPKSFFPRLLTPPGKGKKGLEGGAGGGG